MAHTRNQIRAIGCREIESLGVIRGDPNIGIQQAFAARRGTSAARFHGHKDSVDLAKGFGIVHFKNPSPVGCTVLIENPQVYRARGIRATLPPGLKCFCQSNSRLLLTIIGIEDQRFVFCKKHSAKRVLSLPIAIDMVDLGN